MSTVKRPIDDRNGLRRPPAPPSQLSSLATLIRTGLSSQRRAPLTWGGSIGATCALIAAIWPSIEDSIGAAIENYPESLKQAFGIRELDSVEKYVDAEMLSLIIPLAVAFFAVRCATRALVGAEEKGHLDPLLSLPVSRRALVAGTFIDTAVVTAAILAVSWAMTWIAGTLVGTGISATGIGVGFANVWPISMAFAGFAVFLAGILHRPATVTGIATGTLVAMYVFDLVGKLSPDERILRDISAFKYYGSAIQDGFDWAHAIGLTGVGIALAVVGAFLFRRRDVL